VRSILIERCDGEGAQWQNIGTDSSTCLIRKLEDGPVPSGAGPSDRIIYHSLMRSLRSPLKRSTVDSGEAQRTSYPLVQVPQNSPGPLELDS
jgi:hypothetical protein